MIKVICDDSGLLVFAGEDVFKDSEGRVIGGGSVFVGEYTIHTVDALPTDTKPLKYCYTAEKGFFVNPAYKPSPEEELEALKEKQRLMAIAIDDLILGGMM